VYVCVCVCVCVCIVCVCVFIYAKQKCQCLCCMYVYVCACVFCILVLCMYAQVHIHAYLYRHTFTHTSLHITHHTPHIHYPPLLPLLCTVNLRFVLSSTARYDTPNGSEREREWDISVTRLAIAKKGMDYGIYLF